MKQTIDSPPQNKAGQNVSPNNKSKWKKGRGKMRGFPKAKVSRAEDIKKKALLPDEVTKYMSNLFESKQQKILRFK